MDWIEIACVDDILPMSSRVVEIDGNRIAIFRLNNGEIRAVDNRCPHKGGPLSEGIVSGDYVFCPLHDRKICLSNGEVQAPDTGQVKTYPVDVKDGKIYLLLPSGVHVNI